MGEREDEADFVVQQKRMLRRGDGGLDPAPHRARHPELVNPSSGGYAGGVREYDRLTRAQRIHHDSALESASWGLF